MTTRTWNGASDAFTNGADWSPTGVPVAGDTAVISSGTVTISSPPTSVAIQLVQQSGTTVSTTLNLSNVTLDASSPVTVINNQSSFSSTSPVFNISGTATFAGTESFYGTRSQFVIGSGSTLVNAGTMNFYAASPVTSTTGSLVNNGTIAFVNPNNAPQAPIFGTAISGTGQIALGTNGRVEFDNAVGSGQTLVFNDGASGNEIAQLNAVGSFQGTINGFSSGDSLVIITNASSLTGTYNNSGTSGTLTLTSGGAQAGSLSFLGSYSQSNLTLSSGTALGNGLYNYQITTSVNNVVSAGLPSGYQGGGGSTTAPAVANTTNTVGAVYRFFDNKFGTHFFTSDVGERNTVVATRSADLIPETNGFGDVTQNSTSAVAVYRFFDKNFGTHFFTANSGERDTIINTRSDLTYEANSTFYEHSAQQAGDTAVYRLFDTKTGTQFLTGDTNEYNGLTTAGSSTFRADLRSEGVAFYAPTGQFT